MILKPAWLDQISVDFEISGHRRNDDTAALL